MIKLYQAEWCPFSHRIRAKLTELGIDYEAVNVSASAEKRAKLKEITGNSTIPVLADGEKVFSDSSEILSYLEEEHDLSSFLDGRRTYKVLLAADRKFLRLAAGANLGAATLALLKVAVYEEDGVTRVDAVEPEKAAAQIRNSEVNERGLELRKSIIGIIKALERAG